MWIGLGALLSLGVLPSFNWHRRGTFGEWARLDLGDFTFPLGTNDETFSSLSVFNDGRIRPTPRDVAREICAVGVPMLAMQGASRFWCADAVTAVAGRPPCQSKLLTWENFFLHADTNAPVNAQIELLTNGDFITRSNALERIHRRVAYFDWDDDGLANDIDPNPMEYDGDLFGTGVGWLNANCGSVLSANVETNGAIAVAWHTNVCASAYYWLQFTAQHDRTCVSIECGGESTLGNMVVVANSNQMCRVPLLMGPCYNVTATHPLSDISADDVDAVVRPYSRDVSDRGFSVERSVVLELSGDEGSGTLISSPDVGASISSVTGNCCAVSMYGVNWLWGCGENCHCSGYCQWWRITATWEGYSQNFDWRMQCECQAARESDPTEWVSLSVPSAVMLGGCPVGASVSYEPPESAQGTATLRIASGSGRVALWNDEDRTEPFTLPMTWDASIQCERSFYIEGAALSGSVGDVRLEVEIDTGGCSNVVGRNVTVARVKYLHASSDVQGSSDNPPPFYGEQGCPFSITNSLNPDRHLMIPFCNVVDTNDFSVNAFSVDLRLELEPAGTPDGSLSSEWELIEASPQMSGSLVGGSGLSAQFVNPTHGGVYRFRGRCGGSPWTEANIVLPLSGAEVSSVFENDFVIYAQRMAELDAESGVLERQSVEFGLEWFFSHGSADYLGRVNNSNWPTVWRYNQVNDLSGFGAVATLYGIPARMAKLGNFLAGYGTRRLGVWEVSRMLSQFLGTSNDATADMSWAAATDVVNGSNVVVIVSSLSTNMWSEADSKVKNLWPNPADADNHLARPANVNYNRFFRSPRVIEDVVRQR